MVRVDKDKLEPFVATLLWELTGSGTDAEAIAHSLVLADRRGHSSHGVFRVPRYWDMATDGAIDPTASPIVSEETTTTAVIEGRSAFGQLVGRKATEFAIEKASEEGVAVVGIRDGTHLGRIGEWAERTAEAGLCFMAFVNLQGGSSCVAPAGSADRRLGTNPIAFGVPTFDALPFPIVLDMATSQVAHGKIREYASTGQELPDGWAVTDDGEPVKDAQAFEDGMGAMLPLGGQVAGYKGFGLAVVAELFAGMLSGGTVAGQSVPEYFSNAATMIAVDPTRFLSRSAAAEQVTVLASHLRSTDYSTSVSAGVAAGSAGSLPGEPEYKAMLVADEEGISLPRQTIDALHDLARSYNVAVPQAMRF